jgi:hypothetical protein
VYWAGIGKGEQFVYLAAQLSANERDAVWRVATNLVANASSDPLRAGWSGPCYGIAVSLPAGVASQRGQESTWWRRHRHDTNVLYSIDIKDAVHAMRTVTSSVFDRLPPIDRKNMDIFAEAQRRLHAPMPKQTEEPFDLSIEDTNPQQK